MRQKFVLVLLVVLAGCGTDVVSEASDEPLRDEIAETVGPERFRGEARQLLDADAAARLAGTASPDGSGSIVMALGGELIAYDTASLEGTVLATGGGIGSVSSVPGRAAVLASVGPRLVEVDTVGSDPTVRHEAMSVVPRLIGPRPPGHLFVEDEAGDGSRGLLAYDLATGSVTELDRTSGGHFGVETSPFGIVGTADTAVYIRSSAPDASRRAYAVPMTGGTPVDLTPPTMSTVRSVGVTDDGAFALVSGLDGSGSAHLFAVPIGGGDARLLTGELVTGDESVTVTTLEDGSGSSPIEVGAFVSVGDLVYVALYASGAPVSVHVVPLSGGEPSEIVSGGFGEVSFGEVDGTAYASTPGTTVVLTGDGPVPADVPGPVDVVGATVGDLVVQGDRTVFAVGPDGSARVVTADLDRLPALVHGTLVGTAGDRLVAVDVASGDVTDMTPAGDHGSLIWAEVVGDRSAIVFALGARGPAYDTIDEVLVAPLGGAG